MIIFSVYLILEQLKFQVKVPYVILYGLIRNQQKKAGS